MAGLEQASDDARLLDRVTGFLFYRKVRCIACGEFLGFVWWRGRRRWVCPVHSQTGKVEAVDVRR
jgi:hypothetical protein